MHDGWREEVHDCGQKECMTKGKRAWWKEGVRQ